MKCVQLWAKLLGLDFSLADLLFQNWSQLEMILQSGSESVSCDSRKVIYFTFGNGWHWPSHWTVGCYWKTCSWRTACSLFCPCTATVWALCLSALNQRVTHLKNIWIIGQFSGCNLTIQANNSKQVTHHHKQYMCWIFIFLQNINMLQYICIILLSVPQVLHMWKLSV